MGRKDLNLRWTRPALVDLIEAQEYIAHENPSAAQAVAQHVWDAARSLQDNPEIGRVGHVTGTREWVVTQSPILSSTVSRAMRWKFFVCGTPSGIGRNEDWRKWKVSFNYSLIDGSMPASSYRGISLVVASVNQSEVDGDGEAFCIV